MTSAGTWSGIGNAYTYQWQRSPDNGHLDEHRGSDGETYTLAVADDGDYMRMLVTATNPDGSVSQGSQPTSAV